MNPDSQNPTQEPQENGGTNDMPQAPNTGSGDDQAPAPTTPPADDNGGDTTEGLEAPAGDAPVAPAPDEGDKDDGAKW